MRVYFDNASTTPLLPEVKQVMKDIIDNHYGNPSSIHLFGRQSKTIIEDARKQVAERINASTGEIFFTSGATEANNMALFGSVLDLGVERIISSPTEHHCILHTLDIIEKRYNVEIVYLDVDQNGHIDLNALEGLLSASNKKTMVSLMQANNEIGTVHPIDNIAKLCKTKDVMFHCDMAQSIGKYPLDLNETPIAFLSGSAHKFYGPKGVGFIYVNNDNIIKPMIHGGDQERGMRSGTENIYGIAGMAKAYTMAYDEMTERHDYVAGLKQYFRKRLEAEFYDIQ
ncbi:MAG: cysteine desulfurase, partial [Saprospiraceae bacterium]|nr:cysteine desulfurase [Saprospiraceae bacterium]